MKTDMEFAIDGLLYLTEATLATVEYMNDLKRKRPQELKRQISIAQVGISSLTAAGFSGVGSLNTRTYTVIKEFGGSVQEWLYQKEKE